MRLVFADTFYWTAVLYSADDWHVRAVALSGSLAGTVRLITTEEVLSEVLTFFASDGVHMRRQAVGFVRNIIENSDTRISPQSHQSFQLGLQLYEQRLDKGYSLIDCISMQTMKQLGITEVLTHDRHFTQEGFSILFQ
jgi:uncharacterized protein